MSAMRNRAGWVVACLASMMVIGCAKTPAAPTTPVRPAPPKVVEPPALDVADAGSDSQTLRSKVTRVTVYSDRAQVTRQARAELAEEPTIYAFRKLPGWVDDGSVRVSPSPTASTDIQS